MFSPLEAQLLNADWLNIKDIFPFVDQLGFTATESLSLEYEKVLLNIKNKIKKNAFFIKFKLKIITDKIKQNTLYKKV
ncbi:hypothetical protein GCM10007963_04700 [Lutibacter litoralis]|nr:hypothetical protein GCM10007963_04700 [Lutibacter litoralis]